VRLLFSNSFFVNSIVVGYDCYEISDQLYVFRVCMYVCMCMCVDIYIYVSMCSSGLILGLYVVVVTSFSKYQIQPINIHTSNVYTISRKCG